MKGPWRWLHLAWAGALAASILLPSLPKPVTGPAGELAVTWLRKISVQQHWGMYTPDPQRSHTYMKLVATLADGSEVPLEEVAVADAGWGVTWAGDKTRMAIWRYYANLQPKRSNRNRTWYLRGVCVREARLRGEAPGKIVMHTVRRRFAPPSAVRDGKLALGRPVERLVTVQYCQQKAVRDMIDDDREQRAAT